MNRPWLKFYPADWRADPRLRMCSLAARGLWMDLISYMHEGEPYGHLTIDGLKPTVDDISSLVARPIAEVKKAMEELETRQVFSRDGNGAMYSRRMVRDRAKSEVATRYGKRGGNPHLMPDDNTTDNQTDNLQPKPPVKGTLNPQDKPHREATARIQNLERKDAASAAPGSPEVDLFRRGKEVLGPTAGGLVTKLLASKDKNIPLARAAIEQASTKSDPREYIGAIIRGRGKPENADDLWDRGL